MAIDWFDKATTLLKVATGTLIPSILVDKSLDASKNFISKQIADKIIGEASTRAYQLLAETHRSVIHTIIWQNSLLVLSLLPVYFLHSAVPFYVAYACVTTYTFVTLYQSLPLLKQFVETRSLHTMIKWAVRKAIDEELRQRQFYEQKIVEYLGPDLDVIADDVAFKLHPDIRAALINMGLTLFMAFIAFRLVAIPWLEHRALG